MSICVVNHDVYHNIQIIDPKTQACHRASLPSPYIA